MKIYHKIKKNSSVIHLNNQLYVGKSPELGCQKLEDLLFGEEFLKASSLATMQKLISKLEAPKVFVLGTIIINHEIDQKHIWLQKNYPTIRIEYMIFISSTMLKPSVILEYCKHYFSELEKVVFVDDRLDVLRKAEEMRIIAYHPSSFTE